jgi:hypothetical protein
MAVEVTWGFVLGAETGLRQPPSETPSEGQVRVNAGRENSTGTAQKGPCRHNKYTGGNLESLCGACAIAPLPPICCSPSLREASVPLSSLSAGYIGLQRASGSHGNSCCWLQAPLASASCGWLCCCRRFTEPPGGCGCCCALRCAQVLPYFALGCRQRQLLEQVSPISPILTSLPAPQQHGEYPCPSAPHPRHYTST